MPGSVALAAPGAVLPVTLSRAFLHSREYSLAENEYRNGESQRGLLANTSRKRWRLGKRLKPADLATLRAFYEARNGPQEPFYFYDPYETSPRFTSDPSGAAVQGRYTVRFECAWQQSVGLGRVEVELSLVELA